MFGPSNFGILTAMGAIVIGLSRSIADWHRSRNSSFVTDE